MRISNKLNFYFRLNCGYSVGMGHFSRALRLIQIFGAKKSTLVLDSKIHQLKKYRELKKLFLYDDKKKYFSETFDAELFIEIIKNKKNSIVIVDDYRLSQKWEKLVSNYCLKIICIDDFIDRKHFSDYYINTKPDLYNIDIQQKKKLIKNNKKNCKLLLGPDYHLVNQSIKKINRKEKKISITFYNGSSGNLAIYKKIIKKLLSFKKKKIKINLIDGVFSKSTLDKLFSIDELAKINCVSNHTNLNEILNNTDLLISSTGVILFETSFLEIPTILIQMNNNQIVSPKSMENLGHYFVLKKNDLNKTEIFFELIKTFIKNIDKIKNLSINKKLNFKNNKLKLITELDLNG